MKYFVFCQGDLVIEKTPDGYRIPEEAPVEVKPWTTVMDINGHKAFRIEQPLTPDSSTSSTHLYEMCPLRQSFHKLPHEDYLKAGKCFELLFWDQNTKYCGVCGSPMRFDTPISKKCTQCGKEIWPQLATAVIVLIRRRSPASVAPPASGGSPALNGSLASGGSPALNGSPAREEILLVHAKNFRGDHYGLVAGFVETGETLEEAVYREVMEETGLHITNLRYFGSQPWPYPCGLMVGFTADYDYGKIHLQRTELTKGAWFDRDHLPAIPEKMSIARQLIDYWLEETAEK